MSQTRRQRNHDLMVQEILNTARAIMREQGVAAMSMQELARRLGIRAPSLYNYFTGKMEIYDALFRLGFTAYAAHAEKRRADPQSLAEALYEIIEAYMSFALENPDLYQLCFERPVPGFVPSAQSLELSFGLLHRGYASVARWRDAIDTHLADREVADLVLAMTHGLTALHMANEPQLPVGEGRFGALISAAVNVFVRAWSPPAPQGDKP